LIVSSTPARIPVVAKRGILLPECGLWLDPWDRQERAFVSHAHADHFASHGTIITSKPTARLIEARFRGAYTLEPHMFGRAWTWRGHRLQLLPAGHTLGSAQIHVTRLSDGATLLYTGDFKLRAGRTAEATRFLPADILIMETTFGRPAFRFPSTIKVRNALVRFCRECLEEGEVPVLLAYSLGKAQEIMAQLRDAGFSWIIHPACHDVTLAYEALGVSFPPYEKLTDSIDPAGKVLLVPPSAARSLAVRRIKLRRLAMCTGWALIPGAKYRYQVDEVFPLSDHADYPDLLAAVEKVQPQIVLTTHGFASDFARDLRDRGVEAWSLGADDQLEFAFGLSQRPEDLSADADDPDESMDGRTREHGLADPAGSEFIQFVHTGDAAAALTGRLAKIDYLAAYFRRLADDHSLAAAARFLSGRAVATREQQKLLATGWPVIRLALLNATGISAARLRQLSASQADASRTAYLALVHGQKSVPRDVSFADITHCIDRLLTARGSIAKAAVLETYFRQMTPAEGQYLVKILTGDMRIGLKDGLIEEALAVAFDADAARLREAHTLTGDLGETARLARRAELDRASLTLFQPLRPMLATPATSAQAAWDHFATDRSEGAATGRPRTLWLETIPTGLRAQLHKKGSRVSLFAHDLRNLDAEFPDVLGPAARLPDDVVLDGIVVAVANGRALDTASLPERLARRERDLFFADTLQVRFVVIDLLYHNGESLLLQPLADRRARLESLPFTDPIEVIAHQSADSVAAVKTAMRVARDRGSQGLMVKDPTSAYTAGRRGRAWVQLSWEMEANGPLPEHDQHHRKKGAIVKGVGGDRGNQ